MHEDKEYIKVTFDDIIDSDSLDELDKKENRPYKSLNKTKIQNIKKLQMETIRLFLKKFNEIYFSDKYN